MNEKNKKLIGMIIGVVLFIALILSATYAWFAIRGDDIDIGGKTAKFEILYNNDTGAGASINGTLYPTLSKDRGLKTWINISKTAESLSGKATLTLHINTLTTTTDASLLHYAVYTGGSCSNHLYTSPSTCEANNQVWIPTTLVGSEGTLFGVTSGDAIMLASNLILSDMSTSYYIYIWLDETADSSYVGTTLSGYISASAVQSDIDMSQPVLVEGMIPVKYNGTNWVKASKSIVSNDWYNYDEKQWANAVMVDSTVRSTYMADTYSVGSIIPEENILAYYVWIPRYKYKLFNVDSKTLAELELSAPAEIDIKFEKVNDVISDGTCDGINLEPTNGCYYSHPAFWWDKDFDGIRENGEELFGIWVGKFEVTGDSSLPTIKPNIQALVNQNLSTQFSTSQIFGTSLYLPDNRVLDIDAHMMKNTEWGVVAYLSHSKYEKNSEIEMNDTNQITGMGDYKANIDQSTTGNIYGIYDMSGGSWEYTMGVMKNSIATNTPMIGRTISDNSGFAGVLYNGANNAGEQIPNTNYYNLYEYGTTYNNEEAYNRKLLGDATGETRRWYNDNAIFVSNHYFWFIRGSLYNSGSTAGIFAFHRNSGKASAEYSFRSVLINQ